MTEEIKQKITDLKARIELEGVTLMLYEAWFSVVEWFVGISYSEEECALVLGLPSHYIRLLKQIRDETSGDFSDYAIALYEKVHVEDSEHRSKRFSHYQQYEKEVIDRWMARKLKEDEWAKKEVRKEEVISTFRNAFFCNFGTDIEIRELSRTAEEPKKMGEVRQQQEISESSDGMCITQKKEHQMEIVARMIRDRVISPEVVFEYMNRDNDFRNYNEFLKILDIWEEKVHE